jgi:hypothetical protein
MYDTDQHHPLSGLLGIGPETQDMLIDLLGSDP